MVVLEFIFGALLLTLALTIVMTILSLFIICVACIILALIYSFTPYRPLLFLGHDTFKWHEPIDTECDCIKRADGKIVKRSKCKYCGIEIIQNSYSNWYAKGESGYDS